MRNERSRTMVALPCGPVGIMHGPRRWARLMGAAVVAVLVFVLVPGLGVGPARAVGTLSPVPAVAWHRCPAGSAAAMAGGFLCATVVAPLDYRDLSGPKIKLAVVEHVATGPARRGVIAFPAGRARRGRHSTVPGLDRVLSEEAAPCVRHRELGPARGRREHRSQVLPKRGRGNRVPRQVRLTVPRRPASAGRLHPPLA